MFEVTIWSVDKTKKYPTGLKYSLICIDPITGNKVLFDNHHPKGPHYHIDDEEFSYEFESVDKLLQDFRVMAQEKFGVPI